MSSVIQNAHTTTPLAQDSGASSTIPAARNTARDTRKGCTPPEQGQAERFENRSIVGLTAPQREVAEWIQAFWFRHWRSPTYREIAAGLGMKSHGAAHQVVQSLVKRGALEIVNRRVRLPVAYFILAEDTPRPDDLDDPAPWPDLLRVA